MDLSQLFSTPSKYKILRTLCTRRNPLHLRAIAELSSVELRSAQLALDFLVRQGIIKRSREANRVTFVLNSRNENAAILQNHFNDEQSRQIKARTETYVDVSKVLALVDQVRMIAWSSTKCN